MSDTRLLAIADVEEIVRGLLDGVSDGLTDAAVIFRDDASTTWTGDQVADFLTGLAADTSTMAAEYRLGDGS